MPAFAEQASTKPHAEAGGKALAKGAGGHVEAGEFGHVRVALQAGVDRVEGVELLAGEVSTRGHRRVEGYGGMTLREDEAVAVFPARLIGPDIHYAEVESHKDVGAGEGPSDMAALRVIYATYAVGAYLGRNMG